MGLSAPSNFELGYYVKALQKLRPDVILNGEEGGRDGWGEGRQEAEENKFTYC